MHYERSLTNPPLICGKLLNMLGGSRAGLKGGEWSPY